MPVVRAAIGKCGRVLIPGMKVILVFVNAGLWRVMRSGTGQLRN
jgi:hypothetical protein